MDEMKQAILDLANSKATDLRRLMAAEARMAALEAENAKLLAACEAARSRAT